MNLMPLSFPTLTAEAAGASETLAITCMMTPCRDADYHSLNFLALKPKISLKYIVKIPKQSITF
jgi:hypothetical protein